MELSYVEIFVHFFTKIQKDGMFLIVEISFDRRLEHRLHSKRTWFSFSSKDVFIVNLHH